VLPLLGTKRLDAITDEDIQRLKATMERKNAKTVNNALSVLSKMLKVALEWKVIDRLPATIRLLKPGSAEMAFYEEEDYERLVEGAAHVDERALIAVLLGGDAGLRTGEMIALEWTDIDFRRSLLHVNQSEWEGHIGTPKGGRARTVNMTSRLTAALKAHRHLKGPRVLYSDDKSTADRAGSGVRSAGQGCRSPAGFTSCGTPSARAWPSGGRRRRRSRSSPGTSA